MAAAVDSFARSRETHEVVLRPRGLAPTSLAVDRESHVAWNEQPLPVRAVRETVHVHQGHARLRVRESRSQRKQQRGRCPQQSLLPRSEEHTSELQSLAYLVCRLL